MMFSFRFLISSIPLLEAASISMTSSVRPESMLRQAEHSLHGSPFLKKSLSSLLFWQLAILARILAVVVLPVPRGP